MLPGWDNKGARSQTTSPETRNVVVEKVDNCVNEILQKIHEAARNESHGRKGLLGEIWSLQMWLRQAAVLGGRK
jgi:hypothetical protein